MHAMIQSVRGTYNIFKWLRMGKLLLVPDETQMAL